MIFFSRFLFVCCGLLLLACQQTPELESFVSHPDLVMELSAQEPMVLDPVDMAFDEAGRAFVLEMPGYPDGLSQSRLVWLEDVNGDGSFDNRHLFADELHLASSILPYQGGFLVAAPPDLLFVKDTNGDMQADVRQRLMTGFAEGNLQHNFNGLTYGLDNWIYAANGGNGGEISWVGENSKTLKLGGNDVRFRLTDQQWEIIGESSGGFELAMDEWGHLFETHNLYHISELTIPARYVKGIPSEWEHTLVDISTDKEGELTRIYPIGQQATRVNHPEQAGYFSGACGITYYGGGGFPESFQGNVLVADVVLNLIHRDNISPDGTYHRASRVDENAELLASTDRAFRPVNMEVGPDGAIYLLDMHRKVIEHPEWIPDEIEDTMNLDVGKDQGRIYRITPTAGLPWQTPDFDPKQLDQVVAALGHPNQWWRLTAQRLLVEWQLPGSIPLLEKALTSPQPFARLHALYSLQGLHALQTHHLDATLRDEHPQLRRHTLLLAENRPEFGQLMHDHWERLLTEKHLAVRLQLALSASRQTSPIASAGDWWRLLGEGDQDPLVRWALIAVQQSHPLDLAQTVLDASSLSEGSQQLLMELGQLVGKNGPPAQQSQWLGLLAKQQKKQPELSLSMLEGLAKGSTQPDASVALTQAERSHLIRLIDSIEQTEDWDRLIACWKLRQVWKGKPSQGMQALFEEAKSKARNPVVSLEQRLTALELLTFFPIDLRKSSLFPLLHAAHPPQVQMEALRQLAYAREPESMATVIQQWAELGPTARKGATDALLYLPENHPQLLIALEKGIIQLGEMNFDLERRRELLFSDQPEIRERAEQLFSDAGVLTRSLAMDQMKPALHLAGSQRAGKPLFQAHCASCHQFGREGIGVGPDLTEISRKSPFSLLHDIVDPNAAADTRYLSHRVQLTNGEVLLGLVASEDEAILQLKMMGGAVRSVDRAEIETLRSTGHSLMPEGLEANFSPQQMADLLAYLQQSPAYE
ncbi:MAG: PVC-type heme-binding CxxCH protein [Bacteroidota bacterium]